MNASIRAIIDHMFRDTVDNAETRALHEELLNNCLEHYNDLIGRGMTETEAIDAVVDSLNGMKEVIDEYPKKPGTDAGEEGMKAKAESIPVTYSESGSVPQEEPAEYVYDPGSVTSLRTDLKASDLNIGRSRDGRIHVRCDDMKQLICELNGSVLSVRVSDKTRQSIEEAGKQFESSDITLKGFLNILGKAIGSVASGLSAGGEDVYIDLPDTRLREAELNSKSGDIAARMVLPEQLAVHSMSGDVKVEAFGSEPAEKAAISSMSGDIEFEGNAGNLTMSSMSGDTEARGIYREIVNKSTSGDAEIYGEAERVRVNSVSGDVTVELRNTTVCSIQASSTSGDVDISLAPGTESVHTSMSTVSGSVSCSVPDAGTGARLQIQAQSVSGDVTVR